MTIRDRLPEIRGKYIFEASLADVTWFRVGGPADVVFMPADREDLAGFLRALPEDIPVYPIGVGSNLLVRDGGLRGVVLRLGAPFARVEVNGVEVRTGAAALDATVAKRAAAAGVSGLEFYRGIPGAIGGALRMNAGAYGTETKDVLVEATALDRQGRVHTFSNAEMGFSYRKSSVPDEMIFVEAVYRGQAGDSEEINQRMEEIMRKREESQPIRERTGGSTFKNPDPEVSGGRSSWQLIDSVGGRGRVVGDAQVSEQHCNFLINRGQASAADLENLGESVRRDVLRETGVELHWEIKRIGTPE
ncbi:MAG: UDP-N-acetylmuramate dehydrogenase [Aquisalinus sp.]|nr:UDP-N-acetylmuramate dehydrogenase [Aquisalinus sp.]